MYWMWSWFLQKLWPCLTWWPTEVQQPTMKTIPSLSKPLISTFAPLMADNNVDLLRLDSPLTYLVILNWLCSIWHTYERSKAGNSALCTLSPLIAHPPCSPPTRQSGGPPLHRDGLLAWKRWRCSDQFRCFPFSPRKHALGKWYLFR